MDLSLTDEQHELVRHTRAMLDRRLGLGTVRRDLDTDPPGSARIWPEGCALGWSGLGVPAAVGGSGGGITDLLVLAEEFGRQLYDAPLVGTHLLARTLAEASVPGPLLATLLQGDAVGAWAFHEPGADWWGGPGTTSVTRTSGGWELTGRKTLVHAGPLPTQFLVLASAGGRAALVVVPGDADGVGLHRRATLDITRRYYDVTFDAVALDRSAVLADDADAIVQELRHIAAVLLCADGLGAASRLVEITVEYTKQREQFGRPIGSFQAIKHKCAELLVRSEAARAATYAACAHLEERTADAAEAVSIAKAVCGELLVAITSEALQCHGGIGMTWDCDVHLFLRRIRGMDVLLGNATYHQQRLATLIGV